MKKGGSGKEKRSVESEYFRVNILFSSCINTFNLLSICCSLTWQPAKLPFFPFSPSFSSPFPFLFFFFFLASFLQMSFPSIKLSTLQSESSPSTLLLWTSSFFSLIKFLCLPTPVYSFCFVPNFPWRIFLLDSGLFFLSSFLSQPKKTPLLLILVRYLQDEKLLN